jgi:hypothetical protein
VGVKALRAGAHLPHERVAAANHRPEHRLQTFRRAPSWPAPMREMDMK